MDPVLDLADDMVSRTVALETALVSRSSFLSSTKASATNLAAAVGADSGVVSELRKAVVLFNDALAPRVHDIEIAITDRFLTAEAQAGSFAPFTQQIGGIVLSVAPAHPPEIQLRAPPRVSSIPDEMFLMQWVNVTQGTSHSRQLRIVIPFIFEISPNTIKLRLSASPQFLDSNNIPIDLCEDIPVQYRQDLRGRFMHEVQKALQLVRAHLPTEAFQSFGAPFNAVAYCVSNWISIFSKGVHRGRQTDTVLDRIGPTFTHAIRVHRAHLIPRIERTITSAGAEPRGVRFQGGWAEASAHAYREQEICSVGPISASTQVTTDMVYYFTVQHIAAKTINWIAELAWYQIHVHVDAGGDAAAQAVMDVAKQTLLDNRFFVQSLGAEGIPGQLVRADLSEYGMVVRIVR